MELAGAFDHSVDFGGGQRGPIKVDLRSALRYDELSDGRERPVEADFVAANRTVNSAGAFKGSVEAERSGNGNSKRKY